MTFTKPLIAALLLAGSGEARAFDLVRSMQAANASDAGAWAPLRALGFGGLVAPGSEKTAFDRIVFGLDGGMGGIDARFAGVQSAPESAGIRARIGYAFGDFVAYGTTGVAVASSAFARSPGVARPSAAGLEIGGGLEVALFAGVAARVEYLYVDLDRKSIEQSPDVAFAPAGGHVRAGLNYRF